MSPGAATVRVLLVDDDETFRPALQKTLERMGFAVTPSPNGADAKARLAAESFDLVVSDIRMPGVDGIELTRFVNARPKKTPIILMTGFSEILEARTAYDLGANAFLPKPIDREDLAAAIHACLGRVPEPTVHQEDPSSFCRLSIDDFMTGTEIKYNVFVQLSEKKFVKIAHRGEDLSVDRIRQFKSHGLRFLFLRATDFAAYVGFNVVLATAARKKGLVSREKKLNLLKHTGEIIQEHINHEGLDEEVYAGAASFVQSTIEVLAEDDEAYGLLDVLNAHGDHAYAHGVGASLYATLIAQKLGWNLAANRFKVALGGLFHDLGEKELPRELLLRPRATWSRADTELYESHPQRGATLLASVASIPLDVVQVAKQHHESCNGLGFPDRLRKNRIHPMARLVSISSEFCTHVVRSEKGPGVSPREGMARMQALWADRLDTEFFGALEALFGLAKEESA